VKDGDEKFTYTGANATFRFFFGGALTTLRSLSIALELRPLLVVQPCHSWLGRMLIRLTRLRELRMGSQCPGP
jgi:hypothetical protein